MAFQYQTNEYDTMQMSTVNLTGPQKAAILLGELGPAFGEYLKEQLSRKEFKKICREFRKLGTKYNPMNPFEVNRELSALEEAADYGMQRGIYKDVPHYFKTTAKKGNSLVDQMQSAPEAVARVLSTWLSEDK